MKNGKLVTAMLDSHAETIRLLKSERLEDAQAGVARAEAQIDFDLWMACVADGWTVAELEEAFARRFGRQGDE